MIKTSAMKANQQKNQSLLNQEKKGAKHHFTFFAVQNLVIIPRILRSEAG
jgi:hypothetical protein